LYVSNTISIVAMTEEISIEDAKRIAQDICRKMGFEHAKAEMKTATSKYYAPQTEFEIFVQHPQTQEWIEIGDGGFYSPVACANYGIEYPVLNIGFGVERITMIKTGETDIRRLVHPYFYDKITFSDEDLASAVKYTLEPRTDDGKALAKTVEEVVKDKSELMSPVEIPAWEGKINGRAVKVTLWERDPDVKLVGPAIFNDVWVKDGNILGLDAGKPHPGVKTDKSYLGGLAARVGNLAEELSTKKGPQADEIRVKMAKRASDVNIDLAETARLFITSEKKKFDIRGPVFFGARIEIK
jgi:O-phosphoseryl-tRNA synthetase